MKEYFKRFIINVSENILEALKKIDANKKRFLIVLDYNRKVIGTLTDGDIRRALLDGKDIKDSIDSIYNQTFMYLDIDATFHTVSELFKSEKIDFLPIIDKNLQLLNILTKKQFHILLLEDIQLDLLYDFSQLDNMVLEHEIYNRPWGFYKSTLLTSHAQSKIITIFPKEELSLQEHKKREEHWIIIKGKGKVILCESELDIYPGKYIYIPQGCKHQIINTNKENLILSEVQLGDYFGEDDIIRYSDKYNRI